MQLNNIFLYLLDIFSVCGHMSNGSFVLFGVIDSSSVEVIEAYSRRFHMPFVSPGLSFSVDYDQPNFELYLRPDHTQAVIDMVKFYRWTKVHYLYDSKEGTVFIFFVFFPFTITLFHLDKNLIMFIYTFTSASRRRCVVVCLFIFKVHIYLFIS